ncbi:DNA cytosine methyltransferase [Parasphingorhabdus sp. DH2-15]|uniref:DNA cytosine methyltransferase n=1 Tax=Parasphingorhabdus sp. DH2-15 TaxID=3444112 RepID=UPI003F688C9B
MSQAPITVVSLFSGAMGLDAGLQNVGQFQLLAAVEKEKAFCDTIHKNRDLGNLPKSMKIYQQDLAEFDAETLLQDLQLKPGELDLLVGGPPCQSFSTAGRRGSVQDPRGTLIWDFLRFVEVMQPKYFLMENVRGLLSAAINHRPIALRPDRGESLSEQMNKLAQLYSNLRAILEKSILAIV